MSGSTTIHLLSIQWLEANVETARERIERAAPMALRAERLEVRNIRI